MLRRTMIILTAIVVLVAAVAVAAHLILRSKAVGKAVLARASERIGMDVTAESLTVAWGGRTTIRGVAVKMPLTGETILSADKVEVGHTKVLLLVLGRPVGIRSVSVESPRLYLRRSESGRWNVQDVWKQTRTGMDSGEQVALPQVAVRDAVVEIIEPNEPQQTVGPANFLARPQGRSGWTFGLETTSMGGLKGRLVQGKDWTSEIGFAVHGLGPLVQRLSERDLSPISAAGRWQGRVTDKTLSGRIQLDNAMIGSVALQGDIDLEASANAVLLRLAGLTLSEPPREEEIVFKAGEIRISREAIAVEQLAVKAGVLDGRINGRWDLAAQSGQFSGSWAADGGGQARCHGTCEGSLQTPQLGQVRLEAALTAQATTGLADWTAAATVQGAGPDWRRSNWQVSLPQFVWSREDRRIDAGGAWGEVDVNWPMIRLASLRLPTAQRVQVVGQLDATTRLWSADLQVDDLHLGLPGTGGLDVRFTAQGDARQTPLSEARVAASVLFEDQDIARISTSASVEGRTFHLRDVQAEVLGGSAKGSAQIPLNRWTGSTGQLEWNGIQPQLLQQWCSLFERFSGSTSGFLAVEQTREESRPLGPMRFTLDADVIDGRYGPGQIQACHIAGYVSEDRLLIDQGELDVLGGRIVVRGSLSAREDGYYASIISDLNGLNLDQIVHVINPAAREYAGLASGRISLLSMSDRFGLNGEADIKLTQSDLAKNVVIGTLHNVLSLDIAGKQPKGTGRMRIGFEGPKVVVQSFEYFNRGIEVRGAGQIDDIYLGASSPVNGYAVESTRVLSGVPLPGVRALDRVMATFQRDAASVKIGGTLDDPQVNVVPLPVVSSAFRRLLWSQLRE